MRNSIVFYDISDKGGFIAMLLISVQGTENPCHHKYRARLSWDVLLHEVTKLGIEEPHDTKVSKAHDKKPVLAVKVKESERITHREL